MSLLGLTVAVLVVLVLGGVVAYSTRERFQRPRDRVAAGLRTGLRRLIGRFERYLPWWPAAVAATVLLLLVALGITWVTGTMISKVGGASAAWFDLEVAHYFAENRTDGLTRFYRTATFLGDTSFIFPFVVVFGLVWRWRRGGWLGLTAMGASYLGASVIYNSGKLLVARVRPPEGLRIDPHGGASYPSGHTVQAYAFYFMLAFVLLSIVTAWVHRVAVGTTAVTMATLVGLSRVYLGAHWPTDIIAGVFLGAGWATLLWLLIEAVEQRRGRPLTEHVAPSTAEDLAASES